MLRLTGRPAGAVQAFQQALGAHRPYGGRSDSTGGRDQLASVHNELAWLLATCPDVKLRDPGRAVASARKAVELEPEVGDFWGALGVARYRLGEWGAAIAALEKAESLTPEEDPAIRGFFLAMSHWRLRHEDKARAWYDKAVAWMEKNRPRDEVLIRLRAETEALAGLSELPAEVFVGP